MYKIIWNNRIEVSSKDLNIIVYDEALMNDLEWKFTFTVHTDASDKQLVTFVSKNNKQIAFSWED